MLQIRRGTINNYEKFVCFTNSLIYFSNHKSYSLNSPQHHVSILHQFVTVKFSLSCFFSSVEISFHIKFIIVCVYWWIGTWNFIILPLKPNHASVYWNEQQNGVLVHQCQDLTHRRSEAARCQNWAKKAVALVSHHFRIFLYRERHHLTCMSTCSTPFFRAGRNFLNESPCYKTACFLTKSQRNVGKFDERYRVYFFIQGQMSNFTVFMKWKKYKSWAFRLWPNIIV